jgi:multiple sugar transport system substrate-binding protein/sn-glycerol 3-phosphate transport system substrate-binding protein
MSYRIALSLTAAIALVFSLLATPAGAQSDPWGAVDPSNQNLVFWHNHTRDRQDALQAIVQTFNESNPYGITVTQETQGSYPDIFRKMLGLLGTPEVPDLVVAYQNQAATYQLRDALVDMTSLLQSPRWGLSAEEQADFFPAFFQQDVFPLFDNARLGLAPNRSMEVLYYNRDWLAELGYSEPPSTPEAFKAVACKAVRTPFSRASGSGAMGYQLTLDASRLASWTFAFGGDIFDYRTRLYTYDSDGARQAMAFLQDLYAAGCARPVSERGGALADFSTGRLLFTSASSSGLPFVKAAVDAGAEFDWSVAPLPHTTPTPVMNVYGASVSMPKSTPERELATWLFVRYFTSPEVQAGWGQAANYFPVRQSAAQRLGDYFQLHNAYKIAFDLLPYGHHEPPVPGYDFVRAIAEEALAAIFAQGRGVEKTLARLNQDANASLQEQLEYLPSAR